MSAEREKWTAWGPPQWDRCSESLSGWFAYMRSWEDLLSGYWSGVSPLKSDKVWPPSWMTWKTSNPSLCLPSARQYNLTLCLPQQRCYFLRLRRSSPGSEGGALYNLASKGDVSGSHRWKSHDTHKASLHSYRSRNNYWVVGTLEDELPACCTWSPSDTAFPGLSPVLGAFLMLQLTLSYPCSCRSPSTSCFCKPLQWTHLFPKLDFGGITYRVCVRTLCSHCTERVTRQPLSWKDCCSVVPCLCHKWAWRGKRPSPEQVLALCWPLTTAYFYLKGNKREFILVPFWIPWPGDIDWGYRKFRVSEWKKFHEAFTVLQNKGSYNLR